MQTHPGQLYRVTLRLYNATQLHPVWLVGALAATYPTAELVSLEQPRGDVTHVVLRTSQPTDISAGDAVRGVTEGLPSELPLPEARVEAIEPVVSSAAALTTDVSLRPAGVTATDLLKLGLAVTLIGVVAYANYRIGKKHPREHARAA